MAEDVVGVDRLKPSGKWKGPEGWWRTMDSCGGDEGSHLRMALTVREVADGLTCPLLAVCFLYRRLEVGGTVTTGPRLPESHAFPVQSQLYCEDSREQAPVCHIQLGEHILAPWADRLRALAAQSPTSSLVPR